MNATEYFLILLAFPIIGLILGAFGSSLVVLLGRRPRLTAGRWRFAES